MQYDENAEKYGYEGEMTPLKCDELLAYGMADPAIYDEYEMYKVTEVDAAIAELKEAWRSKHVICKLLKKELEDTRLRERRLNRALWLLKTRYFWILMVYASDLAKVANPSIIHKSNFLGNPTPKCMEEYQHEAELYDSARIKCLKKSEEYKR
jgi:hypothetical protein